MLLVKEILRAKIIELPEQNKTGELFNQFSLFVVRKKSRFIKNQKAGDF